MATSTFRFLSPVVAGALLLSACTVKKQETPNLTGPSELSTSIAIAVSPDVLTQDGASQSVVTITARDSNGQPARSLSLRTEIAVENAITDFGTLSARNVVTDSNGRASVTYTAPAAPAIAVDTGATVQILVTPAGTDFNNASARFASIRLVPRGVIGLPQSPLKAEFSAPSPSVGNPAVFSATVTDAAGADATAQVGSYNWTFGDGGSAVGRNVTHTFDSPGSYLVTLTALDALGRSASATHSIVVGQGTVPTASFLTTPASPVVGQNINFNASGSTAEPGHRIVTYAWNFGDGTVVETGALTTHMYTETGTYTVTLKVTDDVGRKSTLTQQTITVSNSNPTARISVLPPTGRPGDSISFVGNQSTPASGHRIVSYTWNFGDGSTAVGATVTHSYGAAGTYTVSLIVTDEQGNQGIATASVTIVP